MTRLIPIPLAMLALTACPLGPGTACTDIAFASVNLSVVDAGGAPIPGASATWSVDGSEPEACEPTSDPGDFACGWEVAGDITISVEAEGYEPTETVVTVESDACHVDPESVEMVLECNDAEYPSILVTVSSAMSAPLGEVEVTYAPEGGDDASACESYDEDRWACGYEEAGDYVVLADAAGHDPKWETVTVPWDGCHVETQHLDFELEPTE